MGTILDRLVPCMSGSSKRTLRIPFPVQSASTPSTDTFFFSAIAMTSTPAPVVPGRDLEPEGLRQGLHGVRASGRRDRENPALATVAAPQRRGERARRLRVIALPAQRRVRVGDDD